MEVDPVPIEIKRWTKIKEDALINALKFACVEGWKSESDSIRPTLLHFLETSMMNAFSGIDLRANPHIDSKIRSWKH